MQPIEPERTPRTRHRTPDERGRGDLTGHDDRALDRWFTVAIVLKGLDALLEVAGGILLLFVAPHTLQHWVRVAVSHDLAGDPHDFVARHLLHSASQLSSGTTLFGAVYLLSHGLAKGVLVVALLRKQLWAYPWMIALLSAFVVYQLYRLTYAPGVGLVVLTLFDALVAWLTWREWRAQRRRGGEAQPATAATGRSGS